MYIATLQGKEKNLDCHEIRMPTNHFHTEEGRFFLPNEHQKQRSPFTLPNKYFKYLKNKIIFI
jgi:hypothetical protein